MNNNELFKKAGQPQRREVSHQGGFAQRPQINTPQLNSPWQGVSSGFLDDFRKSVREKSYGA